MTTDGHCDASDCQSDGALHAKQVLAPQGHLILVASRPTGIHEARFSAFRRAELSLLTVAQQVHPSASECIRVHPSASECICVHLSASDCHLTSLATAQQEMTTDDH